MLTVIQVMPNSPPTDHLYGERQYIAEDICGHRWTFSETISDIGPTAWDGILLKIEVLRISGVFSPYALEVYKELTMTITVEIRGPIASIILSENVDYSTQEEIQNTGRTALFADQVREIHIDFAEVRFMDSSVIRALLNLQRETDAQGKSLVLLNCNAYMREVFEIGGFDKMFTFR